MKILIAYVPVLHRGYEDFFSRHLNAEALLLFGPETITKFEWLKKDLRCLDPLLTVEAIRSWNIFPKVLLLDNVSKSWIAETSTVIVMPDETECHMLAESEFQGLPVIFESVNLRYDKKKTESTSEIEAVEVTDQEALSMMEIAEGLRPNSPDWWLQVGALSVKDGSVQIVGWNEHFPTSREALFMGDPRSNYGRGINIELSLAVHAEPVVIGKAAAEGIALAGSDFYVTTFPCPPCARLISETHIRRLFFRRGYAILDGDSSLRQKGVEIFRVK